MSYIEQPKNCVYHAPQKRMLSFSRILSDQEVLIVANTSTQYSWAGAMLVDEMLNAVGKQFRVLYSSQDQFKTPGRSSSAQLAPSRSRRSKVG